MCSSSSIHKWKGIQKLRTRSIKVPKQALILDETRPKPQTPLWISLLIAATAITFTPHFPIGVPLSSSRYPLHLYSATWCCNAQVFSSKYFERVVDRRFTVKIKDRVLLYAGVFQRGEGCAGYVAAQYLNRIIILLRVIRDRISFPKHSISRENVTVQPSFIFLQCPAGCTFNTLFHFHRHIS